MEISKKLSLGIDIGGTNIKFAVVEENEIVFKTSIKTAKTCEGIIADIVNEYKKIKENYNVSRVGVGVAGSVDNDILDTTNLPFKNYNLKAELKKYIDGLTDIENDANCAAIAETKFGNVKDCANLVLMTLGTGIGGGVVIDGNIYRGCSGLSGEIGHMIVQTIGGRKCVCGQTGCLEQYASTSALIRSGEAAAQDNKDSILYDLYSRNQNTLSGKDIFETLEKGCRVAQRVYDEYLTYLAAGIDSVVNAFNPEVIILAGGITAQQEKLLVPLMEKVFNKIRVEISILQGDAGALGAAMLKGEQYE